MLLICIAFALHVLTRDSFQQNLVQLQFMSEASPKRQKSSCTDCGAIVADSEALALHLQFECQPLPQPSPPREATCSRCQRIFASSYELELHLTYEHQKNDNDEEKKAFTNASNDSISATIETSFHAKGMEAIKSNFSQRNVHWCRSTRLYHQDGEKWGSCGYRNTMTQLSAAGMQVPDILGLQVLIVKAWNAGFDEKSCAQLGGESLVGSRRWIGACECVSVLRNNGFLAEYHSFKRGRGAFKSEAFVRVIREWFMAPHVPPIYCQWQGHSITIVGFIEDRNQLVVFDPNWNVLDRRCLRNVDWFAKHGDLELVLVHPGNIDNRDKTPYKHVGYFSKSHQL